MRDDLKKGIGERDSRERLRAGTWGLTAGKLEVILGSPATRFSLSMAVDSRFEMRIRGSLGDSQ